MSRILVVGRGEGQELVSNDHSIEFIKSAKSDSGIVPIGDFDFVFQHLSPANPEASDAISHWRGQGKESKVLGFSGGPVPSELSNLGIPCLESLPGRSSLLNLNWGAVPVDFAGTSYELMELLQAHLKENLLALYILCQGYLAVHAQSQGSNADWNDEDIASAIEQMGWSAFIAGPGRSLIPPDLGDKIGRVREPNWWLEVFEVKASIDSIEEEWHGMGNGSMPQVVKDLLNVITNKSNKSKIEPPKIVADAYCAIAQRLANTDSGQKAS